MRTFMAVVLALLTLGACGPDDDATPAAPSSSITTSRPAAVAPEDPICDDIRAQKAINARLHADGYADDYSAEYDALLRASGCR